MTTLRATLYTPDPATPAGLTGRQLAATFSARACQRPEWTAAGHDDAIMPIGGNAPQHGEPLPRVRFHAVRAGHWFIGVDVGFVHLERMQRRPPPMPLARRIALADAAARAAGLCAIDESSFSTKTVAPPAFITASGRRSAFEVLSRAQNGGWLIIPEPEWLQLVVVAPDAHDRAPQRVVEALKRWQQRKRAVAGHRLRIHGPFSVERACRVLDRPPRDDRRAEARAATVLLWVLPPREHVIEPGDAVIDSFHALRRRGCPVLAATPETFAGSGPAQIDDLVYEAWLTRGAQPWRLDHTFAAHAILGLDASHDRTARTSHWAAVLLDANGRPRTLATRQGRLDETLSECATQAFEATARSAARDGAHTIQLHRDGRAHPRDASTLDAIARKLGLDLQFIPVSKRPGVLLYRGTPRDPRPPALGDALTAPDESFALLTTAGTNRPESVALPIKVHRPQHLDLDTALHDVLAAALLPKPGLYRPSHLPATTYWADAFSKTDVSATLRYAGRRPPTATPA